MLDEGLTALLLLILTVSTVVLIARISFKFTVSLVTVVCKSYP
jgi:hypothetical protein